MALLRLLISKGPIAARGEGEGEREASKEKPKAAPCSSQQPSYTHSCWPAFPDILSKQQQHFIFQKGLRLKFIHSLCFCPLQGRLWHIQKSCFSYLASQEELEASDHQDPCPTTPSPTLHFRFKANQKGDLGHGLLSLLLPFLPLHSRIDSPTFLWGTQRHYNAFYVQELF